ncbi:MAG: molybdenum cofactor guanylyltransferase [Actinomycetota bacterium]
MDAPMLSGIVLAGGASRRMGRDKALLTYEGEPLVARAARLLSAACDDVILASGDGRRLGGLGLGLTEVADTAAGAGPLGGIIAGLETVRHLLVAVVAVDMPDLSVAVLGDLAARWDGRSPAIVPRAAGRLEPLHAVYSRLAAPELRAALEAGERSVHRVLEALGAQVVDLGLTTGAFARNLNAPGDLYGPVR